MDKIIVRLARLQEREFLEALQRRASLSNEGDRQALMDNPDALKLPADKIENGLVFVAEQGSWVKGFAANLSLNDGNMELDALFVDPEYWNQGVGRLLVEYCACKAKTAGASCLNVTGNSHAEGFYLSCDFKKIGVIETQFGIGLLMVRYL